MQADLNDLETGTSFFTNVLGWEISPGNPELGGYAQASVSGKAVSGVWPAANSPTPQPDSIDVWLSTNDIEKTFRRRIRRKNTGTDHALCIKKASTVCPSRLGIPPFRSPLTSE